METKKILGLDLGTNSVGWALVEADEQGNPCKIVDMGSRIIPMGAELSKFEQGQAQTKNANRRLAKGIRKLNKRYKQRRNKLIYILQQLNMLPSQIKLSGNFDDPFKIDKISILPISKKQKQYSAIDLLDIRVKALSQKIPLEDLGRIIYLFNQLRGYAGGGEAEDETENNDENESDEKKRNDSYITFGQIIKLSQPETIVYKNKPLKKIKVVFETEDDIIEGDTFLEILKEGESLELMVNIRRSKQGETVTFKLPNKTNWRKKMESLEGELTEFSRAKGREVYLSEYFLEILKENKWVKVRNNVILRQRYQSEFDAVWKEQSKHYPFLNDLPESKLSEILHFIFPGKKQDKYRNEGLEKGLMHVIKRQVIYYQRDLKDQSGLISDCRFEKGEKAAPKSHPVFQEYKIWEQVNKLTINTKTENGINKKGEKKYKYTDKSIPIQLKAWLFEELQTRKDISFSVVLNKLKKEYGLRDNIDFLNGMHAKAKLRGNETKIMLKKLLRENWEILGMENESRQVELWEMLYYEKGNEYDLNSERTSKILAFLKSYAPQLYNPEQTAIQISKIKFSRSYAALSLKAIEKILPLARAGKYFNYKLAEEVKTKIVKLLNENIDSSFEKAAQEYLENNIEVLADGGIMNSFATILIYDKHTAKEYAGEELFTDFRQIKRLKQGELRNPLVEQLINEALIIVADIWKKFGDKPAEIKVELARELKNNAERRAKIYATNRENQKANEGIRDLLVELKQELSLANIEKYKLWVSQENFDDKYMRQYKDPSKSEIEKIKLWREQGHVSPYTAQPIPLSGLFDKASYDVDHIIPQSRYFDDSFTNKIICEKGVNHDKGNRTAMEYFEIGSIRPDVLSKANYVDHVNKYFHGMKRKNLLTTKVPDDPINRQMKETQYISIRIKEELNKIVGNNNVKTTTGAITDYLRNQWGLTDKFKSILKGRYEAILENEKFLEEKYAYYLKMAYAMDNGDEAPEEKLSYELFAKWYNDNFFKKKNNKLVFEGWSKRIDHRHHAIDALVVACTKPTHIKKLNDLNKVLQTWLDDRKEDLLPGFEGSPSELLDEILNLDAAKRDEIFKQIDGFRKIEKPWPAFPFDAEARIRQIIISQKPKDKLLIQETEKSGLQIKMRGQLHEGTLYGKSQGVETYRIPLSKLAGSNFATEKTIEKIVDDFLRNAIGNHLKDYDNKKEEAFSAEGILTLNKKLASKNNKDGLAAPHTPISSIKVYYRDPVKIKKKKGAQDTEDALQRLDRKNAYNDNLYVKTGDNYLFAVLEKSGKRIFDLISFFDAVNLIKEEFNKSVNKKVFNKDAVFKKYFEEKHKAFLLFTLKQGDTVYVPGEEGETITNPASPLYNSFWNNTAERSKGVYNVVKFAKNLQIYFIKHDVADVIARGIEFGSQNAVEKVRERSIKECCIKLNIDRLGNIKPVAGILQ